MLMSIAHRSVGGGLGSSPRLTKIRSISTSKPRWNASWRPSASTSYSSAILNFVDGLKHAVLEDIVLVNKDNAESRMRRAGYLRYTNKTSYGIVEERYTDKDWKTGEKFASSSSDFSGAITPVHETSLLPRYVHFPCLRLTGLQRETPNSSVESIEEAVS